jgi:hypothetical protein
MSAMIAPRRGEDDLATSPVPISARSRYRGAGDRLNRRSGDWDDILKVAAEIVESYDTPVTLRQLFYRLVSMQLIRNSGPEYTQLSNRTAGAAAAAAVDCASEGHSVEECPVALSLFAGAASDLAWLQYLTLAEQFAPDRAFDDGFPAEVAE